MKMPEPFTHYRNYDEQVQPFADENTVPLYDKQALIDLLEAAAVECDQERAAHLMFKNYQAAMALADVADSIRSMKEKL